MSLPAIANNLVTTLPSSGPSFGTALNASFTPLSIAPAMITAVAVANNILTVTAANSFSAGQKVYFSGLLAATFLNGQAVLLMSASGSSFTAFFQSTNYAAADIGTANVVYYFSVSGRDLVTFYNSDLSGSPPVAHHITVFSAPDEFGRKADIVNYAIPNGGYSEFLVLASSLYTQNDGSVQFITDSTSLSALVRSI